MKSMKKVMSIMLVAAMSIMLAACNNETNTVTDEKANETQIKETTSAEVITVGEGATEFILEVVDIDGNTSVFTVNTDKKTVGEALMDNALIEGEDGEYGLYVKNVNGITADYDTDKTYWAFYVDGEYAMTGVDKTNIVDGSTYSFKVEK